MKFLNGWWVPDDCSYFTVRAEKGDLTKVVPNYYQSYNEAFKYITDKTIALDVGGHIGTWAVKMAVDFKDVYTFEPCVINFAILEKNVDNIKNIHACNFALGSKDAEYGLMNYHTSGERRIDLNGKGTLVRTIDELKLDIGLIKIDVEGFEPEVLMGGLETLKRCKPVVIFEDKGHWGKHYSFKENPHAILKGLGYSHKGKFNYDSIYA